MGLCFCTFVVVDTREFAHAVINAGESAVPIWRAACFCHGCVSCIEGRENQTAPVVEIGSQLPAGLGLVQAALRPGANMMAILDFGAVGGIIAGSLLLAFVLQWVSLLGLMSLMPLPARPAPKTVSIVSVAPRRAAR